PQPEKTEPAAGFAVRLTTVPTGKRPVQRGPQLMPAGEDRTVPLPLPSFVTARGYFRLLRVKVAVTAVGAFMVTWHEPVPEQAPLQPEKTEPAALDAVRVTTVPAG